MIILAVMPAAAFGLAYPDSGFLVWRDGTGWFQTPIPSVAIGLAALFYAALLPPFWIWPRKKRAAIVFVSVALLAVPIFAYSRWSIALLPRLAGWSSPFVLFGLYWLRTDKSGWPSLLQSRPRSPAKRVVVFSATCVGILCLNIVFVLTLSGLGSSLFSGDCRGKPPFVRSQFPAHAVFTAKVLFAGRSINSLLRAEEGFRPSGDGRVGDWAIGIVQERFWGMPNWTRLVLLTNYVYWDDETYFVDGRRAEGVVTRLFPIVEGGIGCSRTKPIEYAGVDLRLLRNPPAPGTSHVVGYVREPEKFRPGIARPIRPALRVNAQIQVTGPAFSRTVTTDSTGIYELDDLGAGDYTIELSKAETQEVGFFNGDGSRAKIHIDSGGVVEKNFDLLWNGRIEGQVKDNARKPAHAWVLLLSADGSQMPGYVHFSEATAEDGSYQFRKVPPGRYAVMLNDEGPVDDSPYDLQYYPSGVRRDEARIFELAPSQRIAGIDFRVPVLPERTSQVRVTWANGTAAENAPVCIAYANTDDYESLVGKHCIRNTDEHGLGVIHTYGKSQLRLFAEQFVDRENQAPERFHSQPVQSAADQIPNIINLVLIPEKR
jgi:hypothetical protein